ncbi:MAG: helix-turn-helix transcriptional regulator [Roseiflexaceae bacterium]|nr:helix-turn-helix transcriptional regulator [Roseiflexaceae bacterium]
MSVNTAPQLAAQVGARLREARLTARLTVREAAAQIGLRAHGTLVQYENGHVAPPLERLAAMATVYRISLASLFVTQEALIPLISLLEGATTAQIEAFTRLFQQALHQPE